jgi:hypothetical protein
LTRKANLRTHRRLACRVALRENRAQHPPAGPRGSDQKLNS